jgi:hypothetical protein
MRYEVLAFGCHCERNVVERGNPESLRGDALWLDMEASWVTASRVVLLAMTTFVLTWFSVRGECVEQ